MRVALLRPMPEERFGSIDIYSEHLADALRRADPASSFVPFSVPAWRWPDWKLPRGHGRSASLRTLGLYLSRWLRYPLAVRRLQADIYHVQDNTYGHLTHFLDPARVVVTTHGATPRAWRVWNPEGPSMWLFDRSFRGMLRSSRIIAVSDFVKQELLSGTDYPAERVIPVPHGVDPVFRPGIPAERLRLRSELLQGGERFIVLHVGHSARRKNVEALYRVTAMLLRDGYPARLVRVGRPPSAAQVALATQLGISQAVTHIPPVDNHRLPAYYAAADVFLYPSLYEGFGLPLIEAMGCAVPVVCSDLALFREVCGEAALYADPLSAEAMETAVLRVLADPPTAERLRQLGRQRAGQFTWENAAHLTLDVYRSMLEEL